MVYSAAGKSETATFMTVLNFELSGTNSPDILAKKGKIT